MTANVLEHRRARAFADAVEDRPSTAAAQQFPELLTMVDALDILGSQSAPSLDPEVHMVQRAQLMAEFERAFAGGGGVPAQRDRGSHRAAPAGRFRPSGRWGRKLAVSGLAAGVVVSAFGGVAAASSSAIPGDTLYGVKRGLENWRLDFAGSDAQRGRLLLGEASQRMAEARQLIDRQPGEHTLSPHVAAEVTKALSDMNAEGTQGRNLLQAIYQQSHSLAPMQSLAAFASSQQQQLDAISPHLPSQADPMAGRLQQLLSGISAELAPLHLAPGGSGGTGGGYRPGTAATPSAGTVSGTGSSTMGVRPSSAPQGATTSGTGSMTGGAPGATPSSGGGALVPGLTGGLLGGDGGGSPSTTPPAGAKQPSAAASTPAGDGLTVPPLVPGLLPTIGIGLSGGDG
ncbi:hypothetical protein GXW83_31285 [Streptacidiphilus sp. PB12-B1b]|uniref:DUF5667 domain-containing protein n=1 Tax=Streptacidiphilus sp. PB12-B1b TaxID=2705012 RepID=UPI0015F9A599|nr:DUF5667 domain-containing protein [Streptacidiphilus sp. PB12-B1b]QMU79521.1 hypothetical protein GXW83_31285 [Streptacidiphilus sp. PB12-B1b]